MAIMNINGDSVFLENTSLDLCFRLVSSFCSQFHSPGFRCFLDEVLWLLYILRQSIIPLCWIISYHMPFCSHSRPQLDFSVWSCSSLRCVYLSKVTLLCLWILCGILSVLQGTIHDLLACSRSLPFFVLLIFSTSSVGRLCVCSCLGQFLCLSLFGLMWSLLWLSIRVRVFLVGICSFLVLVCREWRWISWTRNHVFHHGRTFSSLISFLCRFE